MKRILIDETPQRRDRTLVVLCLLGLLLCSLPLVSDRVYSWAFGKSQKNSSAPIIGEISFAKNDIRHKNSGSFVWSKAQNSESIHLGDSVFTGEKSQSQVSLQKGGHVDIDENSMVTFSRINDFEMPNLVTGNFRLAVRGKMKIAIAGEVTEIDGSDGDSEVQVILAAKEKPKVKLLKGRGQIKTAKAQKATVLTTNALTSLETKPPVLPSDARVQERRPAEVATKRIEIKGQALPAPLIYTDQLYDFFENQKGVLVPRANRRAVVKIDVPVSWSTTGSPSKIFAQLSSDPSFARIEDAFVVPASKNADHFEKAALGSNYFRLSPDAQTWSEGQSFQVQSQALALPVPSLSIPPVHHVFILNEIAYLPLIPKGDSALTHFVIELSGTPDFKTAQTKSYWSSREGVRFSFTESQTLFARVRGLNAQNQITASSVISRLEIEKPALPLTPTLAQKEFKIFEDEALNLTWSNDAKRTSLEVKDEKGRTLSSQVIKKHVQEFKHLPAGNYEIKIAGVDEFGRKSKLAKAHIKVLTRPKPVVVAAKETPPAVQKLPARQPSAAETTGSSSLKLEHEIPGFLNREYPNSRLSLEGAAFTVYSQEQVDQGQKNPTALTMGLRVMNWFDSNGFEGSFKSKVANLASSTQGGGVSPVQVEARYHYRWSLPFSPFSALGTSQVSLIAGYELYRNSASGTLFSPKYDLLKTGVAMTFPVLSRWDTGGELLYGLGLDQSKKYEISGFLNFYLRHDWSMGGGYRVHLFEAGSNASSPLGVPYKEAFGEAYSVLRWSY